MLRSEVIIMFFSPQSHNLVDLLIKFVTERLIIKLSIATKCFISVLVTCDVILKK